MFEDCEARDRPSGVSLITAIHDGIPASLARMSRTEFNPIPTVGDLTKELQIILPRWEEDKDDEISKYSRKSRTPSSVSSTDDRRTRGTHQPPLSESYDKSNIEV